jgi:hypothetical protein
MSREVLESLTETELKVACRLHILGGSGDFDYGYCYWGHDHILEGRWSGDGVGDLSEEVRGRKGLSKVLKKLKGMGIIKFARGLFNEDGMPTGAGHAPHEDYEEELQSVVEERGWE